MQPDRFNAERENSDSATRCVVRNVYVLVLVVLITAVGILALENRDLSTLRYFGQGITCSQSLQIVGIFLTGMISGWFMIALARRVMRESA